MKLIVTDEIKERILDCYSNNNMTCKEIGEDIGMNRKRVSKILKEIGIEIVNGKAKKNKIVNIKKHVSFLNNKEDFIYNDYINGDPNSTTYTSIGNKYGVSRKVVARIVKQGTNGTKIKPINNTIKSKNHLKDICIQTDIPGKVIENETPVVKKKKVSKKNKIETGHYCQMNHKMKKGEFICKKCMGTLCYIR